MKTVTLRAGLLVFLVGSLFQFGCLSSGLLQQGLVGAVANQVTGSITLPDLGGFLGGGNGG